MNVLLRPIEIARPASLELGAGLVGRVGEWARARGVARTLVVTGRSGAYRPARSARPCRGLRRGEAGTRHPEPRGRAGMVGGNRPQRMLAEVIAAAKAMPRDWTIAISSLGAASHLATIEFNRRTGLDLDMVACRGTQRR
jgi:hypothetical protein